MRVQNQNNGDDNEDNLPPNRLQRQNGVQPDENGNYPPEIMEAFMPEEEQEEQGEEQWDEPIAGGLNLECWSLNQNEDGTIQVVSYCNQEEHMYAYGPGMQNYHNGVVLHNGEYKHMYTFTINDQVEYLDTDFGRVWRFNLHRYLSLAMNMDQHDGPTNANYINAMLNPIPFQE